MSAAIQGLLVRVRSVLGSFGRGLQQIARAILGDIAWRAPPWMSWLAVKARTGTGMATEYARRKPRVTAMIATMPGFDPERALARPGSTYIPLREATIELLGRSDVAPAKRDHVHVNRYAVEMVSSSLMLGFFFPGARLATPEAVPVS